MTQVTVKELAQVVDTPVERLLQQMREAGLPHTSAEDTNQGARSAVCHISRPCCRPKIQAVTECTSTAHTKATTESVAKINF